MRRRPKRETFTPEDLELFFRRKFLSYGDAPARCRVCGGTVAEHIDYQCLPVVEGGRR